MVDAIFANVDVEFATRQECRTSSVFARGGSAGRGRAGTGAVGTNP
jgi:hypothetical protein